MALDSSRIKEINLSDEMEKSFLDYSMSVIVARALPDARDGLKPSQRRILFAMDVLNLSAGKKHMKCARICGDTSGKYHPHGESVIYPTLVNMAQPWSMSATLVDGQGNFGSIDGDPPAAMRYTEARMTHVGQSMMSDIDKDTVDFVENYDGTTKEPKILPSAIPNLLVNGGTGIAVGMATNMPPHNLGEVVDAICAQIDDPNITIKKIMKIIPGPDFPTGALLCGTSGVEKYYTTGKGSLKLRARIGVEEGRQGKHLLVVTEVPYGMNPEDFIRKTADMVVNKKIEGISDIRNESDENIRIVVELKRDAVPKVVMNNLYKNTSLEGGFSVNMLALDHQRPRLLPIKDAINCYIEHRREVVVRRTRFELQKAEDRAHILEGYRIALDNMDDFVKIIRGSKNREEAKVKLQKKYKLSDRQVNAILEMRLYQLTGLEREKIEAEYQQLLKLIEELRSILASEKKVLNIIKEELKEIKSKYAVPRRTQIVPDEGDIEITDLIPNEGCIITLTHGGAIKRTALSNYKSQKRGGKGVIGMKTKAAKGGQEAKVDFVEHLFSASTHDSLMFFTSLGRVYVEKVYEIPELGRTSKGRSIANVLQLQSGEKVVKMLCMKNFDEDFHVVMATRAGVVKKTHLGDFRNVRAGGIIAINIDKGDELIDCRLTDGSNELILVTNSGMSLRFSEEQLRDQGRATRGVTGIKLGKDDRVIGMAIVEEGSTLLVAGANGIGKRTPFNDYRAQSRAGKGIITMKTTDKTGGVIGVLTVKDEDEIMLTTTKGQMVRIAITDVRTAGRNTMGVKLVNLDKADSLQGIAPVVSGEDEE